MRIDPKYFNVFLVVIAIFAAGLIAFFTLSNRSAERSSFKEQMFAQDSLKTVWWPHLKVDDSLRVADFKGQFVVLDLWSDWSDASLNSHTELAKIKSAYPDTLRVIAASVGMKKKNVISYIEKHQFPFYFVAGTKHFSAFNVPGLPAQMVYNPRGELQQIFLGYSGKNQYDSLRKLLTHGKQ